MEEIDKRKRRRKRKDKTKRVDTGEIN